MRRKDLRFGKTNFYLLFFVPIIYFICMSENVFAGVVIVYENKRNLVDDHSGAASKNIDMDDVKIPIVVVERAPQPQADVETNATSWVVYSGEEIHKALQRWAERAGWSFSWKPKRTWVAPTEVVLEGTFEEAIARFVTAMYEQGKPVRLILWKGNRFAEIVDDESE